MPNMVEVVIDSIRIGLLQQQRVVILKEKEGERYLAIWIDAHMAEQITFALQEVEVARPMTHDLLKMLIREINARVSRVEVIDLKNEVFYGQIVIETENQQEILIDSRPSDALALAVRSHVPIFIANNVLDEAGFHPEEDITENDTDSVDDLGKTVQDSSPENLSIFENFLDNIDVDEDEPKDDKEK